MDSRSENKWYYFQQYMGIGYVFSNPGNEQVRLMTRDVVVLLHHELDQPDLFCSLSQTAN